ncbi:MAG: hypothetical protein A2Y07_04000 [Planctomycetes bacterium GWF2_50_10]|nr:MAG: hypothetical protein A2Y07_04000 [Planctomycetes bacterium GWF2_50_10]
MYTIDLLKGQGIPIKNRRGGLMLVLATFAVPLVVAGVLYGFYVKGTTEVMLLEGSIQDRSDKIAALASAVDAKKKMEAKCSAMKNCLGDIAAHMNTNECWSDIIKTVVDNIPKEMVASNVEIKINSFARPEADKANSSVMKNVEYIARTLKISLLGDPKRSGIDAVRGFVASLDQDAMLSARIEDVRIVGQEEQTADKYSRMRYDIECVFKAQRK